MIMKNSQISVFVILGLFFLILIFLLINTNSRLISDRFERGLGDSIPEALPFEAHLEGCIQNVFDNVLDQLFRQGGILYDSSFYSQYTIPNTFEEGIPVLHGIINYVPIDIPLNFKPQYVDFQGDIGIAYIETLFGSSDNLGLFLNTSISTNLNLLGTSILPKLCLLDGPNSYYSDSNNCHILLYGSGNSTVESQLVEKLTESISSCFYEDSVQRRYNLDIDGDGTISILFADDYTYLNINYSIIHTGENTDYFFDSLSYAFPYRIKKLYSLIYLSAFLETHDFSFDISNRDFLEIIAGCSYDGSISCLDDAILVEVTPKEIGFSRYHLVTFTDISSQLRSLDTDSFLTFQFIIENRRPYLEYIPDIQTGGGNFTITLSLDDPDPGDFEKIITYDLLEIVTNSELTTKYYYSGSWVEVTSEQNSQGNLIIDQLQGIAVGEVFTIDCTEYCVFIGSQYYPTRYFLRASVSDGQYFDYQDFNLTVVP